LKKDRWGGQKASIVSLENKKVEEGGKKKCRGGGNTFFETLLERKKLRNIEWVRRRKKQSLKQSGPSENVGKGGGGGGRGKKERGDELSKETKNALSQTSHK